MTHPVKRVVQGLFQALLIPALVLAFSGCSDDEADSQALLSGSCVVPADQTGSFMGRISSYPVAVVADSTFTETQRDAISFVVAQWNALGQQVLGHDLLRLRFSGVPEAIRTGNPTVCSQNFAADGAGGFYIVRETSSAHWTDKDSLNLTAAIPGATFRCESANRVAKQIIFLYPELADSRQFSSILLHELGHALGLDHSCLADNIGGSEVTARTDFASCKGLALNHTYRVAVMYPWLRWNTDGTPEVKDFLRANDKQRAQCIVGNL